MWKVIETKVATKQIQMSSSSLIKSVKKRFPELKALPKPQLKVVEDALEYAAQLVQMEDVISDEEHDALMKSLEPPGGMTPGVFLKVYRYRKDLTQKDLAKLSGIPQGNISAMESGKRPIGLKIAKALAKILNCDYRRLV